MIISLVEISYMMFQIARWCVMYILVYNNECELPFLLHIYYTDLFLVLSTLSYLFFYYLEENLPLPTAILFAF